jgi:hypothetical protein
LVVAVVAQIPLVVAAVAVVLSMQHHNPLATLQHIQSSLVLEEVLNLLVVPLEGTQLD